MLFCLKQDCWKLCWATTASISFLLLAGGSTECSVKLNCYFISGFFESTNFESQSDLVFKKLLTRKKGKTIFMQSCNSYFFAVYRHPLLYANFLLWFYGSASKKNLFKDLNSFTSSLWSGYLQTDYMWT